MINREVDNWASEIPVLSKGSQVKTYIVYIIVNNLVCHKLHTFMYQYTVVGGAVA